MRSGKYAHRITFERRSTEQDESGQLIDEWTEFAERMAQVEPLGGSETFLRSGEFSDVTYNIRVRYDVVTASVNTFDRIVLNEKPLNIQSVLNPMTRSGEIEYLCQQSNRQSSV